MKKVKIELTDLSEYINANYRASIKQINFIEGLMKQKNMHGVFQKYFQVGDKNTCQTISKNNASKFIKAMLDNKEFVFVEIKPKMKEGKLVNQISVTPKTGFNSVPKKTMEDIQPKWND